MSFPISGKVQCLADIIRSYKWRRVVIIYDDDLYSSVSGVVALISNALRANGSQIDYHIAFPPLHSNPNSRIRFSLLKKFHHSSRRWNKSTARFVNTTVEYVFIEEADLVWLGILFAMEFVEAFKAAKVGVLINTNTRIGREQKVAIEIAAQHFNSSSSPLVLDFQTLSSIHDPHEISTKAIGLINWGAEAIIGAGTWPEVATLAQLANPARVPVLSLAATTATLSSQIIPLLVQMSFPISGEVQCLADIIRSYKWRRVVVIYEDDLYGSVSGIAALLSNALRANGSQIDYHIAFPPLHSNPDASGLVYQELNKIPSQLSKVFVVLRSSLNLTVHLFKKAKELQMMEKDHVWIVNDDITSLLDSTLPQYSFISSYMRGVVGISTYFNTTTSTYLSFSSEFQQRFKQEFKAKGENHFEPGKYAVRAYDAMHVIAHAATIKAATNACMMAGIRSTNIPGLSGFINLTEGGSLSSTFRVLNVVSKGYEELGFWVEGFGLYKNEGEMSRHGRVVDVLRPVFWPGGTEKIPGGWGKLRVGVPNHTTFEQFVKVEYDRDTWKNFDIVVGDITILAKRSESVTFTEPFLSSGLSMLVPIKLNHTPRMILKTFTKEVWILILATLIYTAVVVWYLERDSNPEFDHAWPVQLGATLWLTFLTIFYAHGRIYSYYTKTVIMVWLIVVLILMSSFTANLSSILITEKLEPVPPGSRVGYDGDSFVLKYLKEVLHYNDSNIGRIWSPELYNEAFKSGNISAAYLETPYLRVFLSKYEKYSVTGKTYRLGGFGFVFPKDSPLAADFSKVILQLAEDGILENLEKKWFSFALSYAPAPENERKRDSLSLDSFWTLFVFTGCTSTFVLLLFTARSQSIAGNGARLTLAAAISIEPLRQSFKRIWTASTTKLRGKESFRTRRVLPISIADKGRNENRADGENGTQRKLQEYGGRLGTHKIIGKHENSHVLTGRCLVPSVDSVDQRLTGENLVRELDIPPLQEEALPLPPSQILELVGQKLGLSDLELFLSLDRLRLRLGLGLRFV
ncbi:hypothetical protein Cni_G21181 [Canna indica]|uniref:Ionotropic glutamate receptor C-terminal domain-containing protein n=1 Tax=Canna indica TaxID=4628 RepID=A0AAQ3KPG2_9LILI|nr:hypothetical protein Cni_G21181 [Canna indica]